MGLLEDELLIDHVNRTTFTGDFGINSKGFPKNMFIDGSMVNGIDEEPTVYTDELDSKPISLSGPMHIKTMYPKSAPSMLFPARKYEYSDGTITWVRPGRPWSWENKLAIPSTIKSFLRDSDSIFITLIILIIILYLFSRIK